MAQQYSGVSPEMSRSSRSPTTTTSRTPKRRPRIPSIWDSMRLAWSRKTARRSTNASGCAPSMRPGRDGVVSLVDPEHQAFVPQQFVGVSWRATISRCSTSMSARCFDPLTVYYRYLGWDNARRFSKRVVSKTRPTSDWCFRLPIRFCAASAASRTDLSRNITPFRRSREITTLSGSSSALRWTIRDYAQHQHLRADAVCRKIRLRVEQYNTDPASPTSASLSAGGLPQVLCPSARAQMCEHIA